MADGARDDLIIFGATGFTGKHVVEEMVKYVVAQQQTLLDQTKGKENATQLCWGVAGRSLDKLNEVLDKIKKVTGSDSRNVKRYKADVGDQASLNAMAAKCKVLINCVGPYRFYGDQVVRACVEEGTHYVDVSGEPQFLEQMQLKYNEEAEKKNIYIVGSCGFDSIPTDCGVTMLQQIFSKSGGEMNSAESFIQFDTCGGSFKINHATWLSAIHGVANAKDLDPIRKALKEKEQRPSLAPIYKLERRTPIHYNKAKYIDGWYLPFPGSDISVCRRTQSYLYKNERVRPAQVGAYFKVSSLLFGILLLIAGIAFWMMAQFKMGQRFLNKWAPWLTFGYVTNSGPKDDEMKNVRFNIYIIGKGWETKRASPDDKPLNSPDMTRSLRVSGVNPGYGATCTMVLQSALTILNEKESMPAKGGVLTPGAAFFKTNLCSTLTQSGVTFEEIYIPNV